MGACCVTTPADIADLLSTKVVLQRPTLTDDDAGGSALTLPDGVETLGRLQPRRPRERLTAEQLAVDYDHVLYLGPGVDVQRGDHFHLLAAPDVDYRVVEIQDPSYAGHHLQVLAKRIQPPIVDDDEAD